MTLKERTKRMREEEIEVILICLDNTSREVADPPLSKFSLFLNHIH